MSTILYHGEPSGPSLTVLAALAESGADVECRHIDLLAGERHRLTGLEDRTMLDMSVEGEGPVLVIDGEAMTESVFIAQYLDEIGNGSLQPKDAYKHWEMLMWCRRVTERASPAAAFLKCKTHAHPVLAAMDDARFGAITNGIVSDDLRARWQAVRDGTFEASQEADSRSKIVALADMIEAGLADGRQWLMGDFSIADLVTFPWLCVDLVPECLEGRPLTRDWLARMDARSSIQWAMTKSAGGEPATSWAPGPEINRWG